jgi:hypothetical protein
MNARAILPWLWLCAAAAVIVFVWPTRWRYDRITLEGDVVLVRVDRITGDADMLLPDEGWVPMAPADEDSGPDATPAGS